MFYTEMRTFVVDKDKGEAVEAKYVGSKHGNSDEDDYFCITGCKRKIVPSLHWKGNVSVMEKICAILCDDRPAREGKYNLYIVRIREVIKDLGALEGMLPSPLDTRFSKGMSMCPVHK